MAAARRHRHEHGLGCLLTSSHVPIGARVAPKTDNALAEVTIVRLFPGTLDDDNYIAACKHLRDGIADAFGVPDNHPNIEFWYEQRRVKHRRDAAVHIEVRMRSIR